MPGISKRGDTLLYLDVGTLWHRKLVFGTFRLPSIMCGEKTAGSIAFTIERTWLTNSGRTSKRTLAHRMFQPQYFTLPPPFLAESARTPSNPRTVRRVRADSEQSPNNPYVVRGQSEDSPSTTTKIALVDFARTPLGLFGLSSDSAQTLLGLCSDSARTPLRLFSDFAQTRTLQTVKLAI